MDVATWLRGLGLERYEEAFHENEIDAEVLSKLTADDLKDIGVRAVGHRRKLLEAIEALGEPPEEPKSVLSPHAESAPKTRPAEAERRHLTVLFCDLVSSTELAARLDPEDMGDLIRSYQACCSEIISRWEGHVAKYMGDGILAYFGYPRAHENDAERAVHTGLELCERIGQLTGDDEVPLAARVGIATGLVMVGDLIGDGSSRENTVIGETPNLAARLQALADPGSVIVAPNTRQLLGEIFELEDLGEHALKGFSEPVKPLRVLSKSHAESRFEALHSNNLTALVGRQEELQLLLARWRRATEGEGQVVLLSGESGIGKSRLLQSLKEQAGDEAYTRLRYYCSPYHSNHALHPILDQLERAAGLRSQDSADTKRAKLDAILPTKMEQENKDLGLLGQAFGIESSKSMKGLSPHRQKQRTLEFLIEQLEALAAHKPVMMMLEDAHWIDPTTQEFLDLVIPRLQRQPILIVITYRPEFTPTWGSHAHITQLSLNRLGRGQGTALVSELTAGKDLPADVLDQIIERSDGVPLFIEELTKTVLESGLLIDIGERFDLTGPLPPLAIPATLHDSLMARLDRLAPVKEVAQIGAVIGREFDQGLLAAVLPLPEAKITEALNQLVTAELVFRRGAPPDAVYIFKHALVQEAAYQSLLLKKRRQLHAAIAKALLERFPELVASAPELMAHHCTEASLANEAVQYWQKAGERSRSQASMREAAAYFEKALELLSELDDADLRQRAEVKLRTALGVVYIHVKGLAAPEVEAAYRRASELCAELGNKAEEFVVVWGYWRVHNGRGEINRARELAEQLTAIAAKEGAPGLQLQAHHAMWSTLVFQGDFRGGHKHAEQGQQLYSPNEHRDHAFIYGGHDPYCCCHNLGSWALWALGYPEQAIQWNEEALRVARSFEHPETVVHALNWGTPLLQIASNYEELSLRTDESLRVSTEYGFANHYPEADILAGWLMAKQGQPEAGATRMRDGLEHRTASGTGYIRPYFEALLAEVELMTVGADHALRRLNEALALVEGHGERWFEAELHRRKGDLLITEAIDFEAGEACLQKALKVATAQNAKMWQLRAATNLASFWCGLDKQNKASQLLEPVYSSFMEGAEMPDLKAAKTVLEELHH